MNKQIETCERGIISKTFKTSVNVKSQDKSRFRIDLLNGNDYKIYLETYKRNSSITKQYQHDVTGDLLIHIFAKAAMVVDPQLKLTKAPCCLFNHLRKFLSRYNGI